MNIAMDLIREALLGGSGGGGGGGGGGADQLGHYDADVMLFDFDGTIIKTYTKAEFLALDAYPDYPTHKNLTGSKWTYSLADAKTYVTNNRFLDIGAVYETTDKSTVVEYYGDIDNFTVRLAFASSANNNAVIDWGDGTVETKGSTTKTAYTHTYAQAGPYTCTVKVSTGTITFSGASNDGAFGNNSSGYFVKKIYLGENAKLGNYGLPYLVNLEAVMIPEGSDIGGKTYMFSNDVKLKHITIPPDVTSLGSSSISTLGIESICAPKGMTTFGSSSMTGLNRLNRMTHPATLTTVPTMSGCTSLRVAVVPDGITATSGNSFSQSMALRYFSLGSTVTSTGAILQGCRPATEIHFKPTTPPTIGGTFNQNGSTPEVIYVPAASLDAYKAASGLSQFASVMVGE